MTPRRSNGAVVAAAQSVVADEQSVVAEEQSVVAEEPAAAPYSDSEHGESDWSLMVEPPQSPIEFERLLQKLATYCSQDVLDNIMRFADGCLSASLCQRTRYCFLLFRRNLRVPLRAAAVLPAHWRALWFEERPATRFGKPCQVCNRQRYHLDDYIVVALDLPLQRQRLTVPYWANLEPFEGTVRYVPYNMCLECSGCIDVCMDWHGGTASTMDAWIALHNRMPTTTLTGQEIVPDSIRRLLER